MINETKYRKQAMEVWKASNEQTKQEVKQKVNRSLSRISRLKKSLEPIISLIIRHFRHQ